MMSTANFTQINLIYNKLMSTAELHSNQSYIPIDEHCKTLLKSFIYITN